MSAAGMFYVLTRCPLDESTSYALLLSPRRLGMSHVLLYNNKQNLRWEIMFLADNFQIFFSCLLLDFWTEIGSKVSGMATNIA